MTKELEVLDSIALKVTSFASKIDQEEAIGEFHTIRNALDRKDKLEMALEIIKKDRTLAELDFKYSYEEQCEFYYNNYCEVFNREPEKKFYCTKEEYALLKEVLR